MSRRRRIWIVAVVLTALVTAAGVLLLTPPKGAVEGVDVEDVEVPDPDDRPLAVRIWYPQSLERDGGAVRLPLVVISHGTGGSNLEHADTAIALAQAGFVAAAVNHTGDNYRDDSYVGKGTHLIERPRHIARLIDYMLTRWPAHEQIDPSRIGMFGHSAGGFTALVIADGKPDMSRGAEHCRKYPGAWDCHYIRSHGLKPGTGASRGPEDWLADPRVKSAVIAAPAVGYSFEPGGLSRVQIPIQLWAAEHDDFVDDSPAIIRRLLPQEPEYHAVASAGHFSFLSPCNLGMKAVITVMSWSGTPDVCDDPRGFDRAGFHETFNREVVAFFEKTLPPANR